MRAWEQDVNIEQGSILGLDNKICLWVKLYYDCS